MSTYNCDFFSVVSHLDMHKQKVKGLLCGLYRNARVSSCVCVFVRMLPYLLWLALVCRLVYVLVFAC